MKRLDNIPHSPIRATQMLIRHFSDRTNVCAPLLCCLLLCVAITMIVFGTGYAAAQHLSAIRIRIGDIATSPPNEVRRQYMYAEIIAEHLNNRLRASNICNTRLSVSAYPFIAGNITHAIDTDAESTRATCRKLIVDLLRALDLDSIEFRSTVDLLKLKFKIQSIAGQQLGMQGRQSQRAVRAILAQIYTATSVPKSVLQLHENDYKNIDHQHFTTWMRDNTEKSFVEVLSSPDLSDQNWAINLLRSDHRFRLQYDWSKQQSGAVVLSRHDDDETSSGIILIGTNGEDIEFRETFRAKACGRFRKHFNGSCQIFNFENEDVWLLLLFDSAAALKKHSASSRCHTLFQEIAGDVVTIRAIDNETISTRMYCLPD
jgi:hypothetical protein